MEMNHRKYKIRIVNLSAGAGENLEPGKEKMLIEAVEHLWDLGLVVVVSSGNNGPGEGTIAIPGNSRKVITDTRKERCVYGKKWKFHGDPGRVRCCCFIDGKISEDYQCRGEIKTQGDVHTFTRSRRTGVGDAEYPRFSETLEV